MARFTLSFIALFLFGASILAVLGYSPSRSAESFQGRSSALELVSCSALIVYDGDTFGCDFNGDRRVSGQEEHVRLLGIDAPEMHYSRKNQSGRNEPFALEAKTLLEQSILQRRVYLEFDQEQYDLYNRTLAYVYLDERGERMLNRLLLEKGLAKTLFIRFNRRYEADFNRLEKEARSKQRNLWQSKAL